MRIGLVCDSGCDLSSEIKEQYSIYTLPLTVNYKDNTYQSDVNITTQEIIDKLETEIPTTSLPSPLTIEQVFKTMQADGYDAILYVGISSGLSATNQTVQLVAQSFDGFPIYVFDTKNISAGAGLSVLAAAEMIADGLAIEDVLNKLEELCKQTYVYFTCKTLDYLFHGGRISSTVYKLGKTFNINPVITCSPQGTYMIGKKTRGFDRAVRACVSMIHSRLKDFEHARIGIATTNSLSEFEELKRRMTQRSENIEAVERFSISAALAVHSGPGALGIAGQPDWHYL